MKVVLTKDVPHLGKKFELVTVKNGYGRNYLLPRGLAELATKESKLLAEKFASIRQHRIAIMESQAKELAQQLKNTTVTIAKKGTKTGGLYGSVSAAEIAKELQSSAKITIDPGSIVLEHPIKKTGTTKLKVRLSADTEGSFTVIVKAVSKK